MFVAEKGARLGEMRLRKGELCMFRSPLLLAVLGLAAFSPAYARAAESDKYLPADAEVIASLNVRQLLASELAANHKEILDQYKNMVSLVIQGNEEAKRYIDSLGFDLFRDIHHVTAASGAEVEPTGALLIMDGKFNREKFHQVTEQVAREHGDNLKITKAGEHKVWEVNFPGRERPLFLSLVSDQTLLASLGQKTLTTALTQSPPVLKKGVQKLLKVNKADQTFQFVATGDGLGNLIEKLAEKDNKGNFKQQAQMAGMIFRKMDGLVVGVKVAKDIDFQIGLQTPDAKAAEQMSSQATMAIALGRGLLAQKAKEDANIGKVLEIMNTLKASTEGTTVFIRGQISAAYLDKATKTQNKEASKNAPPPQR
jgi:hypothetical protein